MSGAAGVAVGLLPLLAAGGALASGTYALGLWREVTRPPRRGMAWALAQGLAASPGDLGFEFEERRDRLGGTDIPSWWVKGRDPGSRRAVILLHGHGRSRWDSLGRLEAAAAGAELVVLPDLRGHGDAEGRSTVGRREPADVAALAGTVESERPGIAVTLAGHSMGGVVAIHAACLRAAAGAPLPRVVAWGPYERMRTPFEARLRLRGLPARPFAGAICRLLDRTDGTEQPTSAAAAALGGTALEVHADELDPVSPLAEARAIAAACPGATLHVTRGVPHADAGKAPAGVTSPAAASASRG